MKYRPYQQEAHSALFKYFKECFGNPLIVAPTGSGKSLLVAGITMAATLNRPTIRVLILTHQKELIAQNFEKLQTIWPEAPAGINSASLKSRCFDDQIIFASIQSVANHAESLGMFHLVIVDEAHLIPDDGEGQYNKLINGLRWQNSAMKVVGLTATPYRLKSGHLIGDNTLFTDIVHEIEIKPLIEQGYLSRIVPKRTKTQIDTSDVKKRGGEFVAGELEDAADAATIGAIPEIIRHGKHRRSWIVFCCGISHAANVNRLLVENGINSALVTGETSQEERDSKIAAFKAGDIRCLVNVNVLTTGFDAPQVDLIAVLRPTLSTGLYVQMLGRGMRIADGKQNCLVLDFAGNTERHGPIDCIRKSRIKGSDEPGVAPTKTCPQCETIVHASIVECPECGHVFVTKQKKEFKEASERELLSFEEKELPPIAITSVEMRRHSKPGKPDSVRMDLFENDAFFSTQSVWLCFDHGGYAASKAKDVFHAWIGDRVESTDECVALYGARRIAVNALITLRRNGKYYEIIKSEIKKSAMQQMEKAS